MPTPESPSPSSNYTLWKCPHHPRPHYTHRVQNLTSKTRFSKETFITVGLYMISRFFWCVIFEVWIKGSPEIQLLILRSFKHYFQYEIEGINYQYVCSLSTWTEVCQKTNINIRPRNEVRRRARGRGRSGIWVSIICLEIKWRFNYYLS